MKYYKAGTHQISEDRSLTDFFWAIKGVTYDWFSNQAIVEVYFTPTVALLDLAIAGNPQLGTHSRAYNFACNTEWNSTEVMNKIFELEQFNNSTAA